MGRGSGGKEGGGRKVRSTATNENKERRGKLHNKWPKRRGDNSAQNIPCPGHEGRPLQQCRPSMECRVWRLQVSEGCLLVICLLVTVLIGWCRRCFITPEQWVLYLHFTRLKNSKHVTSEQYGNNYKINCTHTCMHTPLPPPPHTLQNQLFFPNNSIT